jgi:hypothetical protein
MKPWTTDPLDGTRPLGRSAPAAHGRVAHVACEPRWPSTAALHAWDAASLALFRRLALCDGAHARGRLAAAARDAAPA